MPESAPNRSLRVGLMQLQPTRDVQANLNDVLAAIEQAGAQGAELIVVPENALCIGSNAEMRAAAVRLDGPEITAIRDAARRAGATVVVGGFKQKSERPLLQNTALVIREDGGVQGSYDKVHLFNAVVNGTAFRASDVEAAGGQLVIANVKGVKVGLSICFDIRFPEMFRQLARAGAEVILIPAAFTQTTGEAHWEVLVRARAIENEAYVVASATITSDDAVRSGFETYGHALVAGPWGDVMADLGTAPKAVRVVELDLDKVTRIRAKLPVLDVCRPDVYANEPLEI
ncbi:carbon-nitrogen hydrolase [Pusillimonas caeni]|uniref:nitrilase-related carbon-nitrogen hydrolase n=1 Tax=Pusillimonas caeni TaxID=1348472 RepID=UPI000E5A0B8D|nr:nitrilase-related carbon-nitrogen hydrolase [Pusillimonas caeni]TFL13128.1 carbon-nitrogen hydrolase [Pusillimonas caeni]